jgi:hypothetical protein
MPRPAECQRDGQPTMERRADHFASRLLKQYRAEFDSDARLAKKRFIRRLRLKLPPRPGHRPPDPTLDRAFAMHRSGAIANDIAAAQVCALAR